MLYKNVTLKNNYLAFIHVTFLYLKFTIICPKYFITLILLDKFALFPKCFR